MTQKEIYELERMEQENKKLKENGWKREEIEQDSLDFGVDIVIIDSETMEVLSRTVWEDITNKQRIVRLCERETKSWDSENKIAVAVKHRTVGLGEIITKEQIVL